ncbi:MAG: serine hydrolase [Pseudonocardiaceae bacterium]
MTPPGPPMTTTPVPSPPDHATAAAEVHQAIHAVLPKAQIGFAVFDRQNNTVLTSRDADRQFASMSVVKLLIALDALAGDDWATPDDMTQRELHQMLADSDDDIANSLWSTNGGPAIVTRTAGQLGLTGTQPPTNPSRWGDTLITPQDMVTVYRYITDQLSHPARDLLLGALTDIPQRAADGFDQHFGIPDGMPNTTWAVKQGWGTSGSEAVMNSTGLVGADLRYVVVMLVSAPASSYSTVPEVVTAGAGALAGLLGAA